MKVLILSPYLDKPGGVAIYYAALKDYFSFENDFFFRGNPSTKKSPKVLIQYLFDYLRFILMLTRKTHDVYLVNTSFAVTGCSRDQVYIKLLKLMNKKVVVFFHGWNKEYEIKTDKNNLQNKYPLKVFKNSDALVVLSTEFKEKLISWGFDQKIIVETTVVDYNLIKDIKQRNSETFYDDMPLIFLFMARIEKEKGVFEAVDLFNALQTRNPEKKLEFRIAGSGSALSSLKDYVKENNIMNVSFLGHVSGNEKKEAFEASHIFLFPTMHGEGMPICLLEAMAFGLPLLTTSVGGIKDFFIEGKMGITLEIGTLLDLETLDKITTLLNDKNILLKISEFNFNYAKSRFYSDVVSSRLEKILIEFS